MLSVVEVQSRSGEQQVIPRSFQRKWLAAILLGPFLSMLTGCAYVVVGSLGAVGGYVASPDSVEGITESDLTTVWDAAVDIVSIMGMIEEKHEDGGIIVAKIGGARVTITIAPLSQSAVKLNVKARKAFLPKISLAQDVFVKIMSRVNG